MKNKIKKSITIISIVMIMSIILCSCTSNILPENNSAAEIVPYDENIYDGNYGYNIPDEVSALNVMRHNSGRGFYAGANTATLKMFIGVTEYYNDDETVKNEKIASVTSSQNAFDVLSECIGKDFKDSNITGLGFIQSFSVNTTQMNKTDTLDISSFTGKVTVGTIFNATAYDIVGYSIVTNGTPIIVYGINFNDDINEEINVFNYVNEIFSSFNFDIQSYYYPTPETEKDVVDMTPTD